MTNELIHTFQQKAEAVSARVYFPESLEAAMAKAIEICQAKPDLIPQMDPGPLWQAGTRVVAAPNLDKAAYTALSAACEAAGGICLVRDDLRRFPGGIDMGVTLMDFGIAETGTLVLDSASEETRLSTMLCETHVAVLRTSTIRETAVDMAGELRELVRTPGAFTAFITGASRTADIERVLALGVHGPLELHIMLVEE